MVTIAIECDERRGEDPKERLEQANVWEHRKRTDSGNTVSSRIVDDRVKFGVGGDRNLYRIFGPRNYNERSSGSIISTRGRPQHGIITIFSAFVFSTWLSTINFKQKYHWRIHVQWLFARSRSLHFSDRCTRLATPTYHTCADRTINSIHPVNGSGKNHNISANVCTVTTVVVERAIRATSNRTKNYWLRF